MVRPQKKKKKKKLSYVCLPLWELSIKKITFFSDMSAKNVIYFEKVVILAENFKLDPGLKKFFLFLNTPLRPGKRRGSGP